MKEVTFTCSRYPHPGGVMTLFRFCIDGKWEEDNMNLREAICKYSPEEYEWIFTGDKNETWL